MCESVDDDVRLNPNPNPTCSWSMTVIITMVADMTP